jgi:hypothetical protein
MILKRYVAVGREATFGISFFLYRVLEFQNGKVQLNGCFRVACLKIVAKDFFYSQKKD